MIVSRGNTFSLNFSHEPSATDRSILFRSRIEESIEYSVDRLVFNTAVLADECTIEESGITAESNVIAFMDLEGGKRKRKKKVYTKPKKIAHKHAKRPMALLQYYVVESNGKIKKLKHECTKCPVGKYCKISFP